MEIIIKNKTKSRIGIAETKKKVLFFSKIKNVEIESLSISFIRSEIHCLHSLILINVDIQEKQNIIPIVGISISNDLLAWK